MWEFIKHNLLVIYDSLIGGITFAMAAKFYDKKITNPESSLYYKKAIDWIQVRYHLIKFLVLVTLFNVVRKLGFARSISKETETKMAAALGMIVLVLIFAIVIGDHQKRKSLTNGE